MPDRKCQGCSVGVEAHDARWAMREPEEWWHFECADAAGLVGPSFSELRASVDGAFERLQEAFKEIDNESADIRSGWVATDRPFGTGRRLTPGLDQAKQGQEGVTYEEATERIRQGRDGPGDGKAGTEDGEK